jgi:hypothetical protein
MLSQYDFRALPPRSVKLAVVKVRLRSILFSISIMQASSNRVSCTERFPRESPVARSRKRKSARWHDVRTVRESFPMHYESTPVLRPMRYTFCAVARSRQRRFMHQCPSH